MEGALCPKCGSPWRSYERSGVTVDQCTGCRGVFLDRGELERLVDAEGRFYEERWPPRDEEYRGEHERHRERDDDEWRYGHRRRRHRESFLGELFGGDD